MRDRGWAVAAYASGDIAEMFDVQESDAMREWFKLERDDIEEAMCEAARSIFWNECPSVGND
jgi:hypothetical protein